MDVTVLDYRRWIVLRDKVPSVVECHSFGGSGYGGGTEYRGDIVGHGIGRKLHEPPQVPNFGRSGRGMKLTEGLTIAIEPMINIGGYRVRTLQDNWTIVTADGSLSAHAEHSIVVRGDKPLILTA